MMGAQGPSLVILWSLLGLALIAVVAVLLAWSRHHSGGPRQVRDEPSPALRDEPSPAPRDEPSPALQEARDALRLRYARGEIDREEYLQGKVELED